jgi:hypothetical protein
MILAISLISLLFRVAYGIVAPGNLLFWRPGAEWIVGAVVYMLVWCIFSVMDSTAAGISVTGLYAYAKPGRMPGVP